MQITYLKMFLFQQLEKCTLGRPIAQSIAGLSLTQKVNHWVSGHALQIVAVALQLENLMHAVHAIQLISYWLPCTTKLSLYLVIQGSCWVYHVQEYILLLLHSHASVFMQKKMTCNDQPVRLVIASLSTLWQAGRKRFGHQTISEGIKQPQQQVVGMKSRQPVYTTWLVLNINQQNFYPWLHGQTLLL